MADAPAPVHDETQPEPKSAVEPSERASEAAPSADAGRARDSKRRPLPTWLPLVVAFCLAVLVRALSVGLPIEGDTVAYGALARSIAHGAGYTIDGVAHARYPPGHPTVLALALLLGGTVTTTTRVLGLLLGGACAALLVSIGRRVIKGSPPTALLVLLAAAHPTLVLFAGGLVPGAESTGLAMLLAAIRLALIERPGAKRAAVVLTGLLPLVRYDLVAFPIVALVWLLRSARGTDVRARLRSRSWAIAALILPMLIWVVRTWIVSGAPFGTGYASHGLSLARIPRNLLVFLGLILPAAGLGLLWIFVPSGLRRLLDARAVDRPIVTTALIGVALHVALVVVFAGPTYRGESALAFSSGSLRFALVAIPFVILAAVAGLGTIPAKMRGPVGVTVAAIALLPSIWLSSGWIQRASPLKLQAAGRLALLAEAFDAASAEASAKDFVAFDLLPRTNAGVEVFLGDRDPSRRTGVVAAAPMPSGVFPSATELPLRDALGGEVRCWLVSDREYEGVIFTGERPDLRRGGQGIFQRIRWKELPGGVYSIHQVVRPSR